MFSNIESVKEQPMEAATVQPEYLDYRQIQIYCGLSRTSVWRAIKAGQLEAVKVGRSVRVRRTDLDEYLNHHRVERQ
jgi:excisionase family DNA binding protein